MDGILPVYKPVGITSYDVIRAFKRSHLTGFDPVKYKVGHGGTLDPFADGVMLLMLGSGTKQFDQLQKLPKTYVATAVLGASSDTLDATGKIVSAKMHERTSEQIKEATQKFVGEIEQKIPDYSAAKINGTPRYKLARRGEELPAKSKQISIYSLEVIHYSNSNYGSEVEMRISCSSGTYIRQLSYDIFKSLGVESYLSKLTRQSIGDYSLAKCCQIADFSDSTWRDKVVRL